MTGKRAGLSGDVKTVALGACVLTVIVIVLLRLPLFVSGTFVDNSGAEVTDVTVSSRSKMFRFGPAWRSRGEVESRFYAWCLSCGSIRLLFSKDGYMSETLTLYSNHDAHGTPELDASASLFGMLRHVTVTMESIAGVTPLARAGGRVVVDAKRLPMVLELRAGARAIASNRLAHPAAGYLLIDAGRDDDGRIVVAKQRHPNWRTKGTTAPEFDYPQNLVIRFHGRGTGGVLFVPPQDLPPLFPDEQVLRRMRQAPVDGYAETVALPLGETHSNNAWYFYFRSGAHYGKGEVRVPDVTRDRSQLSTQVRVWINETGGRDLRAKHYR